MKKELERTTFEMSRELEFFTEKELEMQMGHSKAWWPIAILKELIDNALDACEIANISPEIDIGIRDNLLSVQDNGPGIPEKVIKKSLDYTKRVSDKMLYVSPTRGQMGNALKTIWAAPFVMDGEEGIIEVWTQELRHIITVSVDRIQQKPILEHRKEDNSFFNDVGTLFRISLPNLLEDLIESSPTAMWLIKRYSAINPHATFRLRYDKKTEEWNDETEEYYHEINTKEILYEATNPEWVKWKPNDPTSIHWYTFETLRDLIAGYITAERQNGNGKAKTVREFVSEFRGITRTVKQKEVTQDFPQYLHDFVDDGNIDESALEELQSKMIESCTSPQPKVLGLVGEKHFREWMARYGNAVDESIVYIKKERMQDSQPFEIEVAFGIQKDDEAKRKLITGLNWSATLKNPASLIESILGEMRVDSSDPVTLIIHMAMPRFDFVDRGKTRLDLSEYSGMGNALNNALKYVTKAWEKAKRHENKVSKQKMKEMRDKNLLE